MLACGETCVDVIHKMIYIIEFIIYLEYSEIVSFPHEREVEEDVTFDAIFAIDSYRLLKNPLIILT